MSCRVKRFLYRRIVVNVEVKCPLVKAVRFCKGLTAHRGLRSIPLPFLDHGTGRGWGVSVKTLPLFTSGEDPVPIVQEAWWVPGPVWTGTENLAPTGIRSSHLPARSQSLYRLCYLTHRCIVNCSYNISAVLWSNLPLIRFQSCRLLVLWFDLVVHWIWMPFWNTAIRNWMLCLCLWK